MRENFAVVTTSARHKSSTFAVCNNVWGKTNRTEASRTSPSPWSSTARCLQQTRRGERRRCASVYNKQQRPLRNQNVYAVNRSTHPSALFLHISLRTPLTPFFHRPPPSYEPPHPGQTSPLIPPVRIIIGPDHRRLLEHD